MSSFPRARAEHGTYVLAASQSGPHHAKQRTYIGDSFLCYKQVGFAQGSVEAIASKSPTALALSIHVITMMMPHNLLKQQRARQHWRRCRVNQPHVSAAAAQATALCEAKHAPALT